jgi:hypothetical protein
MKKRADPMPFDYLRTDTIRSWQQQLEFMRALFRSKLMIPLRARGQRF